MTSKSRITHITEIILTATMITFLLSGAMFGQNAPTHKSAKAATRISAAFSKAAIKYLFTISRNADKNLVDAASVDLDSAASTDTDKSVAGQIDIFAAVYSSEEGARQAERAAGGSAAPNEG